VFVLIMILDLWTMQIACVASVWAVHIGLVRQTYGGRVGLVTKTCIYMSTISATHFYPEDGGRMYHRMSKYCVGSEVLTAVVMNVTIFWDIAPCSPYMGAHGSIVVKALSCKLEGHGFNTR
jgi:hypothetical protein